MLYLEPVFGCNYRCFFCVHGHDHGIKPVQLTPAVFERIKPVVDQAAHIHLTGLGEPFLNTHIEDYMSYFREKGKKYYINTNGALIQNSHIELLLTSFSELSISLDAADKDTYGRMRHPGSWEKVVRTIKRVSDLKESRSSRFPLLYLALNINWLNLPSLKYLPELCSDLRIDSVKLAWTILPETHKHLSPYEDMRKASEMIRPVASALRHKGISIRDEVLFQPHKRGCWNFTGFAFVGGNGMVTACCDRWLAVGDLAVNSFEEIWNGLPHRRIFFGVFNNLPVESCMGCRQFQVVDYVKNPNAFVQDESTAKAILAQKRCTMEKLPSIGNLEKEFRSGFEALTGGNNGCESALDIYTALARQYPDYYEIKNNLAAACLANGQPGKCRELFANIQSIPHNRAIVDHNLEFLKRQNAVESIIEAS